MMGRAQKRGDHHITHELLSSYLDGQVRPRERGQVERHLRACAACNRELELLRYTTGLLKVTPPVSVPRAFTLSEADVGRTPSRDRRRRLSFYLQGATALVAAMLVVVVVGDVLTAPGRYTASLEAPMPMAVPKGVVETVVVEAEIEVRASADAVEEPAMPAAAVEAMVEEAEPVRELGVEATPEPLVAEALRATVVVEAEVVQDAAVAPPPEEPRAAKEAEGSGGEKPEAEMLALAVTPKTEMDDASPAEKAVGTQATGSAAPTVAPAAAEVEHGQETSPTSEPREAVAAVERPQPTPPPEPTVAPQALPTTTLARPIATVAPEPLPERSERDAWPASTWWTLPRLAEITLGGLFLILLGLTLWVRRQ
jgi:anti-sigma factor RsiW